MDRTRILMIVLPVFLFLTDTLNLFTPPPPKPSNHDYHIHRQSQSKSQPQLLQEPLQFAPPQRTSSNIGAIGAGSTVNINFCTSCSFRGTAVTMKSMLEAAFPGINVILANHPPSLPRRVLNLAVPIVQVGIVTTIVAGEHIFPKLGITTPPSWYYSLRSNRFGSMASTWLLGNFFQNFLQSTGAFEVYCNGELVFSKLQENRFPGEIELKDLVGRRLSISRTVDVLRI